jgi:taurine dioxygenase
MATKFKEAQSVLVEKLHPAIGAEIKNVDLRYPLTEEVIQTITEAWHENSVLLFRDQDISEDNQIRFAANFGPVAHRVSPIQGDAMNAPDWTNLMLITDHVDETGKAIGSLGHGEMTFHTDKCYMEQPHRASFLYGIEIPSVGGNTKFASLYAAYDNMSADLKDRLEDAFVMQGHEYGGYGRLKLDVKLEDIHHFRQPLIVTVPGSNKKSLYLSRLNTMWIEGMDRNESEAILNPLFDATEDPENIYEHVWRKGDLLIWDNLSCLHARTDWSDSEKRMLRRCTTEGDRLW